jgi:integrase
MARLTTPLTDTQLKNAKPKEKKYKLSDGGGLFMQINPNGSKLWRLSYRIQGKAKEYAIGTYPNISLSDARTIRDEQKSLVASGIDINEKKKEDKRIADEKKNKEINTFKKVAEEWALEYRKEVEELTFTKQFARIENHVYPVLGNSPIELITRKDIIATLSIIKQKGIAETTRRVFRLMRRIYMYAVTYGYVPHNIMADIDMKIAVGKVVTENAPILSDTKDLKALLLKLDTYKGEHSTNMLLKLLPYIFVRSHNALNMKWDEIDFEKNEWTIEAIHMKKRRKFTLPLSTQAIEIIKSMQKYTTGKYVFPSSVHKDKPLSSGTLGQALKRLGYGKGIFTPHSVRGTFSTIAYEHAFVEGGHECPAEVIEACLAHLEKDKTKAAYNHATYNQKKKELVQWYADYLDGVKKNV